MKNNTKEKTYVLEIGTKLAVVYNEGAKRITLNHSYKLPARTKAEAVNEFPNLLKRIFKCKGIEIINPLHNIKEIDKKKLKRLSPKKLYGMGRIFNGRMLTQKSSLYRELG